MLFELLVFLSLAIYRVVYLEHPFQMTFSPINQAFFIPSMGGKRARDMYMQQLVKWVDLVT